MTVERIPEYRIKEKIASKYVGMSCAWLRLMRMKGGGPPFLRIGRAIVYDTRDLDQWLRTKYVAS